jgi:hypothetical protein
VPDVTLVASRFSVVVGFASASALDAVRLPAATRACRVADDEMAFVCPPDATRDVLDEIARQIARGDSDGFALDLSDGWTSFRLRGDVTRAFSYLSELRLPPPGGFVQGDVLRVPVRVLTDESQIDLFVASPWGRYLHDEMLIALRALDVHEEAGLA